MNGYVVGDGRRRVLGDLAFNVILANKRHLGDVLVLQECLELAVVDGRDGVETAIQNVQSRVNTVADDMRKLAQQVEKSSPGYDQGYRLPLFAIKCAAGEVGIPARPLSG